MVRRVFLLAWILLYFAKEQVFAGAGLFQQETSYGWSPYETQTVRAGHNHTDTAASLNSALVTWEEATNQTAENATKVPKEVAPNKRGSGPFRKTPCFPVSLQNLGVFFAILLCFGLLGAALRRRAPIEPDEGRIREIEARLKRVKALLPAAKTLALAVGSKESHNLLKTFREIVAEKDIAAEGARDAKTLEASLANALKTLRMLHQACLGEADAIAQVDRSFPELPMLGFPVPVAAEDALVDLEERVEQYSTRPLLRTYRSLLKDGTALAERVQAIAELFSSQRPFENEEDGEVLLSTACAFEVLRATSASRKMLATVGQEMGSAVVEGIKLTFMQYHEQALLDIERNLQMMQLSLAIRRNAARPSEDSAAAPLSGAEADAERASVNALEKDLKGVERLLLRLRSDAGKLSAITSLPDAAAAGKKLLDAEQQARGLLMKCSQAEGLLGDLPTGLDDKSRLMALQMGSSNANFVRRESELTTQSFQRLRERLKIAWQEQPSFGVLSQVMAKQLTETANEIAFAAKWRIEYTDARLQNLRKEKGLRATLRELTETSYSGIFQATDKRTMNFLELGARLVRLLENDVGHVITQAGNIASRISRLSLRETPKYKELLKRFEASRRGAKEVHSLMEAANAAADMRSLLSSMQQLLLSSSEGNQS